VPKPNPQARQKRKTFSYLRDSDSKAIFLKICTQMSKRFCAGETFPSKRIVSRKNAIQICLALIMLIPTQNFQKKKAKKHKTTEQHTNSTHNSSSSSNANTLVQ